MFHTHQVNISTIRVINYMYMGSRSHVGVEETAVHDRFNQPPKTGSFKQHFVAMFMMTKAEKESFQPKHDLFQTLTKSFFCA